MSEFGTHLSALRCPDCSDFILSQDPLNVTSDCKCRGCGRCISSDEANGRHEQVCCKFSISGSILSSNEWYDRCVLNSNLWPVRAARSRRSWRILSTLTAVPYIRPAATSWKGVWPCHKSTATPQDSTTTVWYNYSNLWWQLFDLQKLDLSDQQVATKVDCCRHLLRAADILEPGSSQFRAQILFELQAVLEHQAQRLRRQQRMSKRQYQVLLNFLKLNLL